MFQHQPRVGFDTQALDPFVFDPMRSVKCEWEISDGKQIVVGECKSLLRNFAKYIRGMMGGVAQNGRETLKDITAVDRVVGCQTQASFYGGLLYNGDPQGTSRKAAIHIGTGSAAVAHDDVALGTEVQNTLANVGAANESSPVVVAIPTNTAAEFAVTMSSTITPAASNTINEVGLSSRLFHTYFSGGDPSAWAASRARFMMVRDTVAGGFVAVAGTPITVKFTFRFLQTTTSFFTQLAARWFMRVLHDAFPTGYYTDWTNVGSSDLLTHPPSDSVALPVAFGVTDDATLLSMSTQGLAATFLQLTGDPVVTDELTDAQRCRWNVTRSHTFSATKTIRQACLGVLNPSTGYRHLWVVAKLPTPIVVTAGNSQAFKFTFEIAV